MGHISIELWCCQFKNIYSEAWLANFNFFLESEALKITNVQKKWEHSLKRWLLSSFITLSPQFLREIIARRCDHPAFIRWPISNQGHQSVMTDMHSVTWTGRGHPHQRLLFTLYFLDTSEQRLNWPLEVKVFRPHSYKGFSPPSSPFTSCWGLWSKFMFI